MEVVGVYLAARGIRLSRPLVAFRVPAGFPSPAQDEIAGRIIWLMSENPAYEPLRVTEGMDFEVWGRVMYSIHRH